MADVTLAECNGNIWLVGGESHIHKLLFNSLPDDVTVEIISLDTREQVRALWVQNCGEPQTPSDPVLINPAIANRVRRAAAGHTVYFTQWSAMLDEDALTVLRAAASWMNATPALRAVLVEYVDPDGMPGVAELSRVRLTLIAETLAGLGVERERIGQEARQPSNTVDPRQDSQRVDILISDILISGG